jgi:hypothetical protein
LPREHAEFDLRLIEPTSVFRRVVHAKPIRDTSALLLAEAIGQRFAAVDIEVVDDEVDRVSGGVLFHDAPTMRENSAPERLGVAVVKCRPPFGSTTPNMFAVPHR